MLPSAAPTHHQFVHPGSLLNADTLAILWNISSTQSSKTVPTSNWISDLLATPTNSISGAKHSISHADHASMMLAGESVYKCTIAYVVSHNTIYADAAIHIMNDWATINKTFDFGSQPHCGNAPLEYGWMISSFAKAVEILKYAYHGWSNIFEVTFNQWIDEIVLPYLKANPNGSGNWCHTIDEARLQLSIFRDDEAEFKTCIAAISQRLERDIDHDGIIVETFRDLWHAQSGIGALAQSCEIAWSQGFDLYSVGNNALKTCMELHAQMLNDPGNPPAIQKAIDFSVANKSMPLEQYRTLWPLSFGRWPREIVNRIYWPAGYEIAVHHYANRMNIPMPQCKSLAEKNRPERYSFNVGYGTYTSFMPNE